MITKAIILLSIALCVLGDGHHAISEQWIKTIHKGHTDHKEHHGHHGELTHIGSKEPEHHEEYAWSYPSYEFSYKVHDPHTHDMKGQHESRHGDEVKGEYWLIQPDGVKRTVTYHADKHSGFHATVHYSGDHHHYVHHHHEEHKEEENEEGEGREADEAGHSEHEGAPVEEEVDEGHGHVEESHHGEEDVGKWIHDRYWGHHGDDKHHDDRHHHSHDHHEERHSDDHHHEEYEKDHGYGHRHEEHYTGLGSYGRRYGRERAEWHGHDDRHDKHYEVSHGYPDALPKYRSGPIVRENYYHPRFYRQSQQQGKNIKQ